VRGFRLAGARQGGGEIGEGAQDLAGAVGSKGRGTGHHRRRWGGKTGEGKGRAGGDAAYFVSGATGEALFGMPVFSWIHVFFPSPNEYTRKHSTSCLVARFWVGRDTTNPRKLVGWK
jgi:hypothetical protein